MASAKKVAGPIGDWIDFDVQPPKFGQRVQVQIQGEPQPVVCIRDDADTQENRRGTRPGAAGEFWTEINPEEFDTETGRSFPISRGRLWRPYSFAPEPTPDPTPTP